MSSTDPIVERPRERWTALVGMLGAVMLAVAVGWVVLERAQDVPPQIPGAAGAPPAADLVNTTGTAAEAALDLISGDRVELVIDPAGESPCPDAIACVANASQVHIPASLSSYSDDQLRRVTGTDWGDVMLHEYAHTVQNRWRSDLENDPDFRRLFVDPSEPSDLPPNISYPIEHSADCMAASVDDTFTNAYAGACTPDQLAFALTIWDGTFRD